jgi:CheY-like chemotaxis protein
MFSDLEEVRSAAQRAARLTAQLLAFSRKEVMAPKVIQPNDVLNNSQKMLSHILGEDIDFVFAPGENLRQIKADLGQLDQIFMNLAVNAKDAMPDGGKLTIETQNVKVDKEDCDSLPEMEAGDYVVLSVKDTGHGMDAETMDHIFEPFFTTKGIDKGVGLGLSTVYGIMKQSSGYVCALSEPNVGTTFKCYFPAVMEDVETISLSEVAGCPTGTETILLAEDEEMVRQLTKRVLEKHGYKVIENDSGEQAYSCFNELEEAIDLLLTDVIMPGINGQELCKKIRAKRPGIKTLFMSGYTNDVLGQNCLLEKNTGFIEKPFSIEALTQKVRQVLDQ